MIPRRKLPFVTTDADVTTAAERMRQTGMLRLPLCEPAGGLDAPVGLLHVKDLLIAISDSTQVSSIESLARPLERVLDAMLVNVVVTQMRQQGHEFVLVVDEHDTTVGGVALETIIDLIVGELEHGIDPAELDEVRREDGALVASGSAFVHAVARLLGLDIRDIHQATIGGVVIERLGRAPRPGDVVDVDGLRLEVTAVQDGRVLEVRIMPAPAVGTPARDEAQATKGRDRP
jgi:CBS domain containing-hemolysin-like protein